MAEIADAIEKSDAYSLKETAHSIKGSLGSLGAKPAFEIAAKLESMGREGKLDNAEAAYQTMETEMQRLIVVLNKLKGFVPAEA